MIEEKEIEDLIAKAFDMYATNWTEKTKIVYTFNSPSFSFLCKMITTFMHFVILVLFILIGANQLILIVYARGVKRRSLGKSKTLSQWLYRCLLKHG